MVTNLINYNLLAEPAITSLLRGLGSLYHPVLSPVLETDLYEDAVGGEERVELESVESLILHPVYDSIAEDNVFVAFLWAVLPWDRYFQQVLPEGIDGIICVLENTCGQIYSFQINGPDTIFLGEGDLHESAYDAYAVETTVVKTKEAGGGLSIDGTCIFNFTLYPSTEYEESFVNQVPLIVTVVMAGVICFASIAFLIAYGRKTRARERKLVESADRSHAIVSSLFPPNVRDRLLEDAAHMTGSVTTFGGHDLNKLLDADYNNGEGVGVVRSSKPIADLFPACTVFFADIVGFTAWSSSREPSHVFTLLESIYGAFDTIARSRDVFKVETVG
jgi:Adenylate and Guanylate cyclase catalytic domain